MVVEMLSGNAQRLARRAEGQGGPNPLAAGEGSNSRQPDAVQRPPLNKRLAALT